MMSIALWTRPPERAALNVSCRSLGRPPATGMIRLANLTPLDVGAEADFGAGLDDGAAKDFGSGMEKGAGKDFAPDAREDFGPEFGPEFGEDGGRGIDGDIGGSFNFHTPNAGWDGKS